MVRASHGLPAFATNIDELLEDTVYFLSAWRLSIPLLTDLWQTIPSLPPTETGLRHAALRSSAEANAYTVLACVQDLMQVLRPFSILSPRLSLTPSFSFQHVVPIAAWCVRVERAGCVYDVRQARGYACVRSACQGLALCRMREQHAEGAVWRDLGLGADKKRV